MDFKVGKPLGFSSGIVRFASELPDLPGCGGHQHQHQNKFDCVYIGPHPIDSMFKKNSKKVNTYAHVPCFVN